MIWLKRPDGRWCDNPQDIEQIIIYHFGKSFAYFSQFERDLQHVLDHIRAVVTIEMNRWLFETFMAKEASKALSQMHSYKSPSPDGFSPVFFFRNFGILLVLMLLNLFFHFKIMASLVIISTSRILFLFPSVKFLTIFPFQNFQPL